jgi:hypothetical protein
VGQRLDCGELPLGSKLFKNLRNQTSLEWELFAIDGNPRRETMACLFIDRGRQNTPDESAEKVDRKVAPKTCVLRAVENLFGDQLEQWMRGSKIEKPG